MNPDIRYNVVDFINIIITPKTDIPLKKMLGLIGITGSKYYHGLAEKENLITIMVKSRGNTRASIVKEKLLSTMLKLILVKVTESLLI